MRENYQRSEMTSEIRNWCMRSIELLSVSDIITKQNVDIKNKIDF